MAGNLISVSQDALWKGIIEDLFDDFLLYFYPEWANSQVDWEKGFSFLDKELEQIWPQSDTPKRFADKLVKVHTRSGQEQWVLVHVEVQGYRDSSFPERMFTYFYRIRDRFGKNILALAILTDKHKRFHPKFFKYQFLQTSLKYRFDTFKLLEKSEEELYRPNNPFGLVLLTAKKATQKADDATLFGWKRDLVKTLYQEGYSQGKIRKILNFIRFYVSF